MMFAAAGWLIIALVVALIAVLIAWTGMGLAWAIVLILGVLLVAAVVFLLVIVAEFARWPG